MSYRTLLYSSTSPAPMPPILPFLSILLFLLSPLLSLLFSWAHTTTSKQWTAFLRGSCVQPKIGVQPLLAPPQWWWEWDLTHYTRKAADRAQTHSFGDKTNRNHGWKWVVECTPHLATLNFGSYLTPFLFRKGVYITTIIPPPRYPNTVSWHP